MTLLRSALLTGAALAFCGISAAQLVPGGEPPPEVPVAVPEPPPPPQAVAPVATGLVTTTSLEEVKTLLTSLQAPFTIEKASTGRAYIAAKPNGWYMFVNLIDCADDAAQTGCTGVQFTSGAFNRKANAKFVNEFNDAVVFSHAVLMEGDQSYTRLLVGFNSGVAPTYLGDQFVWFQREMGYYADELDKAMGAAPATGGTFAAGTGMPDKVQTGFTAGQAENIGLAGQSAAGTYAK